MVVAWFNLKSLCSWWINLAMRIRSTMKFRGWLRESGSKFRRQLKSLTVTYSRAIEIWEELIWKNYSNSYASCTATPCQINLLPDNKQSNPINIMRVLTLNTLKPIVLLKTIFIHEVLVEFTSLTKKWSEQWLGLNLRHLLAPAMILPADTNFLLHDATKWSKTVKGIQ